MYGRPPQARRRLASVLRQLTGVTQLELDLDCVTTRSLWELAEGLMVTRDLPKRLQSQAYFDEAATALLNGSWLVQRVSLTLRCNELEWVEGSSYIAGPLSPGKELAVSTMPPLHELGIGGALAVGADVFALSSNSGVKVTCVCWPLPG